MMGEIHPQSPIFPQVKEVLALQHAYASVGGWCWRVAARREKESLARGYLVAVRERRRERQREKRRKRMLRKEEQEGGEEEERTTPRAQLAPPGALEMGQPFGALVRSERYAVKVYQLLNGAAAAASRQQMRYDSHLVRSGESTVMHLSMGFGLPWAS